MILMSEKELSHFCPKSNRSKLICFNNAHWKTFTFTTDSMKLYRGHVLIFCNKPNINISLMWAD